MKNKIKMVSFEDVPEYTGLEKNSATITINKSELIHTISKYYGTNFNGTIYLNRFFDYDFNIPMSVGKYYNLSMREFNILSEKMNNMYKKYNQDCERSLNILVKIYGTILCTLGITNMEKARKFKNGELYDEVLNIYKNVEAYKNYINTFWGADKAEERIHLYYDYYFNLGST